MHRISVAAFLLSLVGLVQAAEPARYGQPLPDTAAVPVSEAVAAFDQHAGKAQRYSGRITRSRAAGWCWRTMVRWRG